MMDTDAPTIAERYVSAGQSSNLKCETGDDAPLGDAAVLIAAGWSPSRIGAALLRLHTKVERNTLAQVHEQLALQAERWRLEQPVAVAAAVLAWWLDKTCGACHGVKFSQIAGTPVLSTKACKACRGAGEKPLPHGEAGKRLSVFADDCVSRAVQSIRNRLHTARK